MMSVSYTHLDVYKRQGNTFANEFKGYQCTKVYQLLRTSFFFTTVLAEHGLGNRLENRAVTVLNSVNRLQLKPTYAFSVNESKASYTLRIVTFYK